MGLFSLAMKRKLAQWLFVISGILHAALYPLALIAIAIGFWRNGLGDGLLTMLLVIIATVALRFVIVGLFGALIALIDPSFLH